MKVTSDEKRVTSEKYKGRNERFAALIFLAPLLLLTLIFIGLPVAGTIATSLHRDVSFLPEEFVFLRNYAALAGDTEFLNALGFTLLFAAVSVPLEILLGLVIALVLNERLPMRGALRACALVPWAVPTVVSARLWQLVFNYEFGIANLLLTRVGLAAGPVNFLGTSCGAFGALVVADVWKTAPFVAIILLAGLQTISEDLYEQARIDQANLFQRFRHITLPLLAPVAIVAVLFRTIDALRIFDLIYVITGGGPGGSTATLSIHAYHLFTAGDFGRGSASSVVLFAIAFVLALALARRGQAEAA